MKFHHGSPQSFSVEKKMKKTMFTHYLETNLWLISAGEVRLSSLTKKRIRRMVNSMVVCCFGADEKKQQQYIVIVIDTIKNIDISFFSFLFFFFSPSIFLFLHRSIISLCPLP